MINFRGLFNKSVLTSNTARAKRILRSNAPGAWYDPSDLTQAKATWRRNLLTYSEQFDNAAWIKAEITVVANSAIAPDGTVTADKAIPSVVNTSHGINNVALTVGVTYTATLYAKNAGYRYLALTNSGSDPHAAIFDLNTGSSVKGASVISANAESVGSGWYRCAVTFVAAYTGFTQYLSTSATAITLFAGDGTSGVFIWGAQLELGSSPTAYQKITDYNTEFLAAFPQHALYQDSTGTTPVTAVEQPVGLMLDKSQGLVLGAERVTNGDFSSATGWSLGTGWSISGGVATKVAGVGDNLSTAILPPGTGAGKYFSITLTATVTVGSLAVSPGGYQATTAITASGIYTFKVFTWSPASNYILYVVADAAFAGTVDNISVREIPGNHLIQPTATSRPTLSSRYNLLTKTEQFDDGVWFKAGYGGGLPPTVIANDASGPASDGFADKVTFSAGAGAQSILFTLAAFSPATYRSVLCLKAASPGDVGKIIAIRHALGGAYLFITLTADYQVISRNETAPAAAAGSLDIVLRPEVGTSSGEVSIHLAYASLTTAADAALPYQRVNTATDYDYDFSKFPPYLRFDGVDDSMYSAASVDFNGAPADGQTKRNLLSASEAFDDAAWTKLNVTNTTGKVSETAVTGVFLSYQSVMPGGGTYTLSVEAKAAERSRVALEFASVYPEAVFNLSTGTVQSSASCTPAITALANGWYRCSITATLAAGSTSVVGIRNDAGSRSYAGAAGSGVLVRNAQVEIGSTATAYQKTGTDKMTVFAGVHKVSTSSGTLFETSSNSDTNNGSFSYATGPWLDTRDYFSTRGSVLSYPPLTVAPPDTYVITAASDISGDLIVVRKDAGQVVNSSADLGVGNFGNYPLYVGRRNNASLPFNGRLYQLAIKGKALTAAEISTVESFVNSKTKAY